MGAQKCDEAGCYEPAEWYIPREDRHLCEECFGS